MDIVYKGGALLAAQAEGVARVALALPAAVLWNAAAAATRGRSSPSAPAPAAAPPSAAGSRCPFSGLIGSAATCPGARMAAAAAAAAATKAAATAGGGGEHGANEERAPLVAGSGNSSNTAAPPAGRCWWVEGRVTHVRRRPARHAFGYDVRLALLDLDDPPAWFARSPQRRDHLSAQEARAAAGTGGRVLLLTLPAAAGYVQNPISVYYCYDSDGDDDNARKEQEANGATTKAPPQPPQQQPPQQPQQRLRRCVAEVTNTPWGERVSFVFDPRGAAVPKSLHVSPFMDMRNVWLLKATDPLLAAAAGAAVGGEEGGRGGGGSNTDDTTTSNSRVVLSVLVDHPELGRYFDAQFVGKVVAAAAGAATTGAAEAAAGAAASKAPVATNAAADGRSERSGLWTLWRYGFLPQRVALWIYVHAVLLALKGVSVQPKPGADTYAARAAAALEALAAARGGGGGKGGGEAPAAAAAGGAPPIPGGPRSGAAWAGRAFVWRPALKWPWYLE